MSIEDITSQIDPEEIWNAKEPRPYTYSIEWEGHRYWYQHKLAKHRIDICLATTDPQKYCNGYYLYSTKDPGDGMAYVIVKTDNPELTLPCDC